MRQMGLSVIILFFFTVFFPVTSTSAFNSVDVGSAMFEHAEIHGSALLQDGSVVFTDAIPVTKGDTSRWQLWAASIGKGGQQNWELSVAGIRPDREAPFLPVVTPEGNIYIATSKKILNLKSNGERLPDIVLHESGVEFDAQIYQLVLHPEGGILLAGFQRSGWDLKPILIHADVSGQLQATTALDLPPRAPSQRIQMQRLMMTNGENGSVYIAHCSMVSPRESFVWLFKVDVSGALSWAKRLEPTDTRRLIAGPVSLHASQDGGVVFVGLVSNVSSTQVVRSHGWAVDYDSTGELRWQSFFGDPEINWGSRFNSSDEVHGLWGVKLLPEGYYLAAGRHMNYNEKIVRPWLQAFDVGGNALGMLQAPTPWPAEEPPQFAEVLGLFALGEGRVLLFGNYRKEHIVRTRNANFGYGIGGGTGWFSTLTLPDLLESSAKDIKTDILQLHVPEAGAMPPSRSGDKEGSKAARPKVRILD